MEKREPPTLKWWYELKRDYSDENKLKFLNALSCLSFNDVYEAKNTNEAFDIFFNTFSLFYNLCFPTVRVKVSNKNKVNLHWLSKGIKVSCKKKRLLYYKLQNKNCEFSRQSYRKYNNSLKKCISSSRKINNAKYISKAQSKCKAVWNVIKKHTVTEPHNTNISKITVNNHDYTDPAIMADHFNEFFINTATNNNFDNGSGQLRLSSIKNIESNEKSIFLYPIQQRDLKYIIMSLNNSKASGYDGIRTDILKLSINIILEPLLHIINLSLEEGLFPTILKRSIVKPLYKKKGEKTHMDNYRPVTLIPIFSKIFEKVFYIKLAEFLEKHKIIKEEQNGFRKNKSTSLAAFQLIKSITENIDSKIPVSVLFMDMSKAFDHVCHKRLLEKVYRYGIRGTAYNWLDSYLSNRKQSVEINGYNEKTKTVDTYQSSLMLNKYGVPQGSILGPLLFLLYINDFPSVISHKSVLFADDITIIIEGKNRQSYENEINTALNNSVQWLELNNLKVNISKTRLMQFHTYRTKPMNLNISCKGITLSKTDSIKFLGITLDKFCSWKDHIENICGKMNSFLYPLRRISCEVSRSAAITAYHGYISSILRYGVIMWGRSVDIDQAFVMQKKCLRAIFGLKQTDSCRPFFKKYKILTLPCLYVLESCIFVFKHKELFQPTASYYTPRSVNANKLYRPRTNLTCTSNNCYIMCIKLFNKIPNSIKTLPFPKFKRALVKQLTDRCFYSVHEFLDYKL